MQFKEFINESNFGKEHKILSLYRNFDFSIRKIRDLTGESIGNIYRILEKYAIKPNRQADKRLVQELVKNYHTAGIPLAKIAELTGYTKRHIRNLCN